MDSIDSRQTRDPFYYRHRNFFVGLFVILPLLIIPALLIFALVKAEIFEKRIELYIRCETASGLKKTTPVSILGQRVGTIKSIALNENGYVDVVLKIKSRYHRFIHRDSRAQLRQKNFVVGDWEIDLTMGNDSTIVEDGDTLQVEYQIRLEKMVELFTDMMKPLESILESLEKGEGLIKYLFGSDTVLTDFHGLLGRVDKLFGRVDKTLNFADRMIADLSQLGSHGSEAVDSLISLTRNVDVLLKDLHGVVFDLDSLVIGFDSLPEDIDTVIHLLKRDLNEAETLLKGAKNHWFLRRTIRKMEEQENP